MMVFLDANPVIYLIEQPANLGSKVTARVADLLASGERLAVSDLVRMECQVGPLKANDAELLARYATFFSSPDLGNARWGSRPMAEHRVMSEDLLDITHYRSRRCYESQFRS